MQTPQAEANAEPRQPQHVSMRDESLFAALYESFPWQDAQMAVLVDSLNESAPDSAATAARCVLCGKESADDAYRLDATLLTDSNSDEAFCLVAVPAPLAQIAPVLSAQLAASQYPRCGGCVLRLAVAINVRLRVRLDHQYGLPSKCAALIADYALGTAAPPLEPRHLTVEQLLAMQAPRSPPYSPARAEFVSETSSAHFPGEGADDRRRRGRRCSPQDAEGGRGRERPRRATEPARDDDHRRARDSRPDGREDVNRRRHGRSREREEDCRSRAERDGLRRRSPGYIHHDTRRPRDGSREHDVDRRGERSPRGRDADDRGRQLPGQAFPRHVVRASRESPRCPDYGLLRAVEESRYSCLQPWHAAVVRRALSTLVPRNARNVNDVGLVVDGTANVGCDSLHFASVYPNASVWAVEKHSAPFECLHHNVAASGLGHRVWPVHRDLLDLLATWERPRELVGSIILYLDPPWSTNGGGGSRGTRTSELRLSSKRIDDVLRSVARRGQADMAIVKLPPAGEFDVETLRRDLRGRWDVRDVVDVSKTGASTGSPVRRRRETRSDVAFRLLFADATSPY